MKQLGFCDRRWLSWSRSSGARSRDGPCEGQRNPILVRAKVQAQISGAWLLVRLWYDELTLPRMVGVFLALKVCLILQADRKGHQGLGHGHHEAARRLAHQALDWGRKWSLRSFWRAHVE